jgi:hypothetical protein
MDLLISLVVVLIIVGVLLYAVTLIPMDARIKQLINVVVIVAVVLWLLVRFLPHLDAVLP